MESVGSVSDDERVQTANKMGLARHTLGIILLSCVVFLWTASNFLASTILADDSYSHPFFITYVNTSFFIVFLIIVISRRIFRIWRRGKLSHVKSWKSFLVYLDSHGMKETMPGGTFDGGVEGEDEENNDENDELDDRAIMQRQRLLDSYQDPEDVFPTTAKVTPTGRLGLKETARLAAQFCLLWFLANYFALACLQYTTVGSTTILTSTSGVWTLIFGAMIGVEKFTARKCLGVLASLAGVILISRVDMSTSNDEIVTPPTNPVGDGDDGSSFPNKTSAEIALGDAMAAFSAIVYGVYTIVMKKQVGDESRVNMQLFFGMVGFFNVFFLWPGFIILHKLDIEPFSLPSENRIWIIILVTSTSFSLWHMLMSILKINSLSSLISDICWAYAMLLTTPLVVTVGLSLTIPLSLVGQIILQGEYASVLYWIGAVIVFLSFLIVNHESKEEEEQNLRTSVIFSEEGSRTIIVDQDALSGNI
ncbi:hypothetical protein BGW36DRAFT_366771 [Talaromyces proteolyticus]|uniref:EamA domain-containing protein n=1 Tax=Talaromyces proteolyticus TaxID=1131652 RepID=A0AAD4L5Q4_9EURO|nr:uncharacterized protein BGW36DRAFT_366771 [Talaromyces proteolyticus]KAH8705080.1 hypothetical protein BGW36DRAFT_366771 [Talaromyces proteolyticus]